MALRPISVSQLNDYISNLITDNPLLSNVQVIGEISNLKYHSSGHVYFSINDDNSKVNCFFPASYVKNLAYELGDGLEVIVTGSINVYKKGGYYSLFVRELSVSGEGNLSQAFQLMKEKLEKEGLFDKKYKKPIPIFPNKIGIVTSETGAALQDILKIITSRNNVCDIMIFPVKVQGEGAAIDIAEMIDYINQKPELDIDTLIVGRGGGSTEDLWAFNEEILARSIFNSKIPIISAVGHEIDFSISDFVADLRAETPTAAAEIAVPDIKKEIENIETLKKSLLSELKNKISYDELRIKKIISDIENSINNRITDYLHKMENLKLYLEENNPNNILSKGYSIIENNNLNVVSSIEDFKDGEDYLVHFKNGKTWVRINHLKNH